MVNSAARPGCGQRHGAPQPRILDQLLRLGLVRPENPSRSTGRNGCSCRITRLMVRNGDAGRRVPGARRSTFKLAPAALVVFSDCTASLHRKPDSESGALCPCYPKIGTRRSRCFAVVEVQRSAKARMTADRAATGGDRRRVQQSIFQTLMIALSVVV